MNISISPSPLPIRWQGNDYILKSAGIANGDPYVLTEPSNPELEAEIKMQLSQYHGIRFYWRTGYCELA